MSEINNTPARKRKLSNQESVIEISDEDACLENSCGSGDVEIVEPGAKILHIDTVPSQSSDSNLEFATLNSQSSVEILSEEPTVDLKQRLLELDDEIRQLKAENEELKSKSCSCQRHQMTDQQESIMNISFNNVENFQLYKDKLIKLFELYLDLYATEDESNLLLNISKDNDIDPNEWVVIDEDDVKAANEITTANKITETNKTTETPVNETKTVNGRPHKKKKKKPKSDTSKDESDGLNDFFVLDTTPSLSTKNVLKYESKFRVLNSPSGDEKDKPNEVKTPASTCFNCNENHNLRDCPKPKNFGKINANRQKFKSQQPNKSMRYHMEDDQRFGHLQPGKISEKLQEAMGLRNNQLPHYIYRMRQLGYPPGWFNEILAVQQSELVLFDFEGKGAFNRKKTVQDVDPDKVVEYPGFNVPLAKGVKDEHRLYGCPSYSKATSKQSMLDYVRGMQKKSEDNLESCDMDIDNTTSDKEVELINSKKQVKVDDANISPTLVELESEKLKLLEQLTEDNTSTSQAEETQEINQSSADAYKTIDITGTVDELGCSFTGSQDSSVITESQDSGVITESQDSGVITETSQDDSCKLIMKDQDDDCKPGSPTRNLVKTTSFGTPILKSASPYCRLPNAENFTKDVSDVINFENLPNSTGKYEQMVGVIEKVRRTLKGMNDQKS